MDSRQKFIAYPIERHARFSFVEVFRESVDFTRAYTLPFNMISVVTRAEGERASVWRNLRTGRDFSARLNDVVLVPYNLPQEYRHTTRNERLDIHFRLELYPGVDVFGGIGECVVENSPRLRREAEAMFAIEDRVLMLSRCMEFTLSFCHRHWPATYPFDAERMKPFDDVLHYIRNEADARTGVDEIARCMHCSTRTFTRLFHEVFRISPKQFLQREVFQRSALMLQSPAESVKSTAAKMGFSSEFYFSRFFKRLSGMSPMEYRARSSSASGGK